MLPSAPSQLSDQVRVSYGASGSATVASSMTLVVPVGAEAWAGAEGLVQTMRAIFTTAGSDTGPASVAPSAGLRVEGMEVREVTRTPIRRTNAAVQEVAGTWGAEPLLTPTAQFQSGRGGCPRPNGARPGPERSPAAQPPERSASCQSITSGKSEPCGQPWV